MRLGVNIDHVATLREARYRGKVRGEPDPVGAAVACEAAGAHGITIHLREDRRHIQDRDALAIRERVKSRLNFEMANTPAMVDFALGLKPEIVCLVPERREEVTTEGGLDVASFLPSIARTCVQMKAAGIEVSLFITPEPRQVEAAAKSGAPFIELHTGAFAESYAESNRGVHELDRLISAARLAKELGLRVNAGHGLNYSNVHEMRRVPFLEELNIGHSIISRSVGVGLTQAVREMLDLIRACY